MARTEELIAAPKTAGATSIGHVGPGVRGLLSNGALRTVFQPIVSLESRVPVGVEALLRGPAGTSWESPGMLFEAAAGEGLVAELDWASRRVALQTALASGLTAPASLFLNAEPEGLRSNTFPGFDVVADRAARAGLQVVLEITERALTSDPAELLATVARVRELGWRIALDDVGAERASLALLPFLAPDVIKLDLRLVQQRTSLDIAEIVNAVLAHSERAGSVILAEGIETEHHLAVARSLGAVLGQGWLFGRPDALDGAASSYFPLQLGPLAISTTPSTPWELVSSSPAIRITSEPLLVALSKTLERQAVAASDAAVVLSTFQHVRHLTPNTISRYARLADTCAFVAAIGQDIGPVPAAGVRGASLAPDDPLSQEWNVTVVAPHFAGALIARDLNLHDIDGSRLFSYTLTYDRDRVLAAARSLMARIGNERTGWGF